MALLGLIKASTTAAIKMTSIKPAIVPRRSSSPYTASSTPFKPSISYNKDLFLAATIRIQHGVRAKRLDNTSSSNTPLIPQPPFDFISDTLKQQQKFDPSFEKLRALQAIHVLSVLQFHPILTAYQLTLIDFSIFRKITITALKNHKPKSPQKWIVASTDFFNYLTRLIEHGILIKQAASDRARYLNYWIKVASKCHELKNYQTLKAIISALGTPPIQRLKQSWTFVPKKSMQLLENMNELMSESCNYEKYRHVMLENSKASEPTVPFLGIFLHDMTYLAELQDQKGARATDLIALFSKMQKRPDYPLALPDTYTKDIASYNRPKFSIRAATAVRKSSQDDEHGKLSIDMQQCLVTQYLLTRPWVNEKTVDELCVLREPTKPQGGVILTSSVSLTTAIESSTNSLSSTTTTTGRPLSLEDSNYFHKKINTGFWLFGRKSVDHHTALQSLNSFDTLYHSSNRLSFDNDDEGEEKDEKEYLKKKHYGTMSSQSNNSLAIFRKDYWKNNNSTRKFSLSSFSSDPSLSAIFRSTEPLTSHPLDNTQPDTSSSFI
ncbi:hypothetical protein G6F57_000028 [Rhizopus arrhizus]|nr:hypothetical protein G6F23_006806 [Rhizopus arrhizus]KAG1429469.1 hypothetical protein G6F58_000025 [Rhizopus delemar]KAG0770378.1 hypothetical protein G6F24_000265 [Rhizopus arrhizus]KAG0788577.1 hypothetical protein G6F22_006965 [Rhizopus arrhizus]KAG0797967.1 hypothetical protein G6F21_000104 [Rhizopus arrhizus]